MADDKLRATPAARKLADDLGINLYDVSGSGANGRVHKEDVETYKDTNVVRISPLAKRIALEHNIAWQEIQGTGHRGKIMKKDVLALLPENIENDSIKSPAQIEKVEEVPDNVTPYGEIERIPMTPMRKVALVEKSELGGTCLNRGCIPTKTYLHNAEIIENIGHAANRGIVIENPNFTVDMEKLLETKSKVVNTLVGGVAGLLRSYGVTVHKGIGTITKDKNVLVNGSELLETKKIILAGGSKVSKINVPGMESPLVMTSDDILEMNEVPESLVIIGGGVVGIELGQAFMTFGSKVTVIEMMDRIVPAMDAEVSKNLRLILERKGMTILTGTKLQEIIEENGQLRIKVEGKDDIIASKALLSIGRMPDLEGIGEVEFELDRGCIKVNEYMETSVPGIYAPGDINGTKMLAHAAFRMGEVAAENALKGNHAVAKLNLTPAAIYTLPEVAAVGLTEEQAREKYDVAIGKFNFAANGRAIASDAAQGFVKVIADKKCGEILGVHIIGPAAAELINEASSIIEMEITVEEMLKTIHGHPTYSEVMYEAFADVLGMAIHSPKKK
ncbi:dihydrolipoyl dehydrogenase [Streptococcus pneumoniae]|nr:dihydrolipoyl dehydrogenase [Streptococcus pneumoniae]